MDYEKYLQKQVENETVPYYNTLHVYKACIIKISSRSQE
jgi:hypothetical protein